MREASSRLTYTSTDQEASKRSSLKILTLWVLITHLRRQWTLISLITTCTPKIGFLVPFKIWDRFKLKIKLSLLLIQPLKGYRSTITTGISIRNQLMSRQRSPCSGTKKHLCLNPRVECQIAFRWTFLNLLIWGSSKWISLRLLAACNLLWLLTRTLSRRKSVVINKSNPKNY